MIQALAYVVVALGSAALLIPVSLLLGVNTAYPLSVLWGWFLVPLGAPALSLAQTMGVVLVVGVFKGVSQTHSERSTSDKVTDFIGALTYPWFALGIGWVIKAVWL